MFTVDVPKFRVSFFTFYTISRVLYNINTNVIRATADLLNEVFGGEVAEEEEEEKEEEAFCAKCAEKDAGKTD